MRYHVTLDPAASGEPIAVDVVELANGELDVRVGGKRLDVDAVAVGRGLSVLVGGRVVDVAIERGEVFAGGSRARIRVESERQRAADAAKGAARGAEEGIATSPMPGRIVKVLVGAGDAVTAGQPLVVMEAMKMENEIRAKIAGKVARVHVAPGDKVEGNAKLVTVS